MQVNLIHNGYSPQRRKMYPSNPRNNMVSTVDLAWQRSFGHDSTSPKQRKEQQLAYITDSYNQAVEGVIQREKSFDKSSFRVMPVHPIESKTARNKLSDSLSQEMKTFKERGKIQSTIEETRYPSQVMRNKVFDDQKRRNSPIQNSSNVSSTIFGYDINYDSYKKQSYFSKMMSDRLQPYLNQNVEGRIPKHRSFTINNPVPIYYS